MKRREFFNATLSRIALGVGISSVVEASDLWSAARSASVNESMRPTPLGAEYTVSRERTADKYVMTYEWTDRSEREWCLEFPVERSAYKTAASESHGYLSALKTAKASDHAKRLVEALPDASTIGSRALQSFSELSRFERAIGLVRSLDYVTDAESTGRSDYIRTVVETLVDGCGDCEDLAYLLVGMLSQPAFDYRTAAVVLPGHMLAAVHRDDLPSMYADAPTLPGGTYVAIESVTARPIGDFQQKPVLVMYNDGVEYVDQSAIADTGEELL